MEAVFAASGRQDVGLGGAYQERQPLAKQ